jgi:hypothetical protein
VLLGLAGCTNDLSLAVPSNWVIGASRIAPLPSNLISEGHRGGTSRPCGDGEGSAASRSINPRMVTVAIVARALLAPLHASCLNCCWVCGWCCRASICGNHALCSPSRRSSVVMTRSTMFSGATSSSPRIRSRLDCIAA